MDGLASVYELEGKFEEAKQLRLTLLAASRRVLGDEHPTTLV
jgi:hypothetical protein